MIHQNQVIRRAALKILFKTLNRCKELMLNENSDNSKAVSCKIKFKIEFSVMIQGTALLYYFAEASNSNCTVLAFLLLFDASINTDSSLLVNRFTSAPASINNLVFL